jgi:hypothetical protein
MLFLACVFLVLATVVCASDDQAHFSETLIPSQAAALVSRNGKFWNDLASRQQRIALVAGIEEGIALTLFYTELERNWDAAKVVSESLKRWHSPERLEPSIMADQITLFYSNDKNLQIPILRVFVHITSTKKGASPELASRHIELLRQQYATPLRTNNVPALEPIPPANGANQPTAEKEAVTDE